MDKHQKHPVKDRPKSSWDITKDKAKSAYSGLTEDDFHKAAGSEDKLFAIITQKFGDAKDAIRTKLSKPVAK